MLKSRLVLITAAAASLSGLASCVPPPPVPPPRFRPNPPYAPEPVPSAGADYNVAPQQQQPVSPPPTSPGTYPMAQRTANPNEVLSPYEPYNVIDVEGFKSGQLARDPSNQKIFRVP